MARVRYEIEKSVATITMDDGKVNALSPAMFEELNGALDQARSDGAVVVLSGRGGVFSAGFDLPTIRGGGPDAAGLLRSGFEFAERLLSFPTPVVIACTGHTIAMGVFVLLSGDHRIGPAGPCKIAANEVAIGMTMPRAAIEVCRQRLTPAAITRAVLLSETFAPEEAVTLGFLDRLVEPSAVVAAAQDAAEGMAALDMAAHEASKRRMRAKMLTALRAAIETDDAEFRGQA